MLDNTSLFSPNDYKNNDKIIYKYFKDKYCKKKPLSLDLRLKNDKTRDYFLEEIKQNKLRS